MWIKLPIPLITLIFFMSQPCHMLTCFLTNVYLTIFNFSKSLAKLWTAIQFNLAIKMDLENDKIKL